MGEMTFPAKIMKPMRITIPEAVKDGLALSSGDLVQVTVKKITKPDTAQ
jgi:bifunctional DNA-binding transcriptional regulator/antitoxin component of YhaV-PrlF toxin-antitoxin module